MIETNPTNDVRCLHQSTSEVVIHERRILTKHFLKEIQVASDCGDFFTVVDELVSVSLREEIGGAVHFAVAIFPEHFGSFPLTLIEYTILTPLQAPVCHYNRRHIQSDSNPLRLICIAVSGRVELMSTTAPIFLELIGA